MSEISWAKGSVFTKADAVKVYKEIESLCKDTNHVEPASLVEFAKDPETELHKCFTWDDSEAARKWRLAEARGILCHIVYKNDNKENDKIPIRVYYKKKDSKFYEPTRVIVSSNDSYKKLLEEAYNELRFFRKKYSSLAELSSVLDAINSLDI